MKYRITHLLNQYGLIFRSGIQIVHLQVRPLINEMSCCSSENNRKLLKRYIDNILWFVVCILFSLNPFLPPKLFVTK